MGFCEDNPKVIKKNDNWYYVKNNKIVSVSLKKRLEHLPIPPVYNTFWISKNKNNNILAIWEDSNKRKQYLYNDNWTSTQKKEKYDRMKRFVKKVDTFWKIIDKDLSNTDLKIRTIAYMFKLLKITHIRVGNLKYYNNNNSIGLTTLRKNNLEFKKGLLVLKFKGKSNIYHEIIVKDKNIITFMKFIIKKEHLTEWVFTVNNIKINPIDMSQYLKDKMGKEFKIKDFRTISANRIFIDTIKSFQLEYNITNSIKNALKITATKLGHNTSTSKKSYVSENIISFYKTDREKFIKLSTKSILKK